MLTLLWPVGLVVAVILAVMVVANSFGPGWGLATLLATSATTVSWARLSKVRSAPPDPSI